MLSFISDLRSCNIDALDGEMGKVKDVYVDDHHWAIRYALIDTWKTLPGRRVMLSPASFENLDLANRRLHVKLDKETIRKSPDFAEQSDLTLETEGKLADYYGWTKYWIGNMMWGTGAFPVIGSLEEKIEAEKYDPSGARSVSSVYSLRSEDGMVGYRVHAADGRLGELVDGVFDTETWGIQSFVIKLRYQPEIGLLLVSPKELAACEWIEGDLYINSTLDNIKSRPIYRSEKELHAYLPNL